MRAILIINICAILLPTIISNGVVHANDVFEAELEKTIRKGETINGIFKPLEKLGSGCYSVSYKGQFIPYNNMEIAMKFAVDGREEYKMYTYLNAIRNPNVLFLGIPSICYFGRWNNYTMLGMTLLDTTIMHRIQNELDETNVLYLFGEFVRIMKYIHSRGVIHVDPHCGNIAIQNNGSFMFDFGESEDMALYRSREKSIEKAKRDFEFFLRIMFKRMQNYLPTWHWIETSAADSYQLNDKILAALQVKLAQTAGNQFSGLRRVFIEFSKQIVNKYSTEVTDRSGQKISFYDHLYQVIGEECENYGCEASFPIMFIPDPFKVKKYVRPKLNYEFFETMYAKYIQFASGA